MRGLHSLSYPFYWGIVGTAQYDAGQLWATHIRASKAEVFWGVTLCRRVIVIDVSRDRDASIYRVKQSKKKTQLIPTRLKSSIWDTVMTGISYWISKAGMLDVSLAPTPTHNLTASPRPSKQPQGHYVFRSLYREPDQSKPCVMECHYWCCGLSLYFCAETLTDTMSRLILFSSSVIHNLKFTPWRNTS
jgi:hypothetical protein